MKLEEFEKFKADLNRLLRFHYLANFHARSLSKEDADILEEHFEMERERFLKYWGAEDEIGDMEGGPPFTSEEYIAHIKNICGVNEEMLGKK